MHLVKAIAKNNRYFLFDDTKEIEVSIINNSFTADITLTDAQKKFISNKLNLPSVKDKVKTKKLKSMLKYEYKRQKAFDNFEDYLIYRLNKQKL